MFLFQVLNRKNHQRKPPTNCKAKFQRMFLHLYFQIILFFFHLLKYILVSTNKTIPRLICGINHHFEPFSFLAPVKGFSGSFWIKIYFYYVGSLYLNNYQNIFLLKRFIIFIHLSKYIGSFSYLSPMD